MPKLTSRYPKVQVLLIDPDRQQAHSLSTLLDEAHYTVSHVSTGEQGWAHLQAREVDVVICHGVLPDLSSFVICQRIKANPQQFDLRHTHFLLILDDRSQLPTQEQQRLGRDAGADGFLYPPFDAIEVKTRIQSGAQLHRALSTLSWTNQRLATLTGLLNNLGLLDLASHCLNRQAMLESLPALLAECRAQQLSLGMLRITIDGYPDLKKEYSERVVEEIVQAIAGRLLNNTPPQSIIYRCEVDAFLCVTPDQSLESAQSLATALSQVISSHPISVDYGLRLPLTVSICGVADLPDRDPMISLAVLLEQYQNVLARCNPAQVLPVFHKS